ncbi:hypothetical protein BJV82DRAFT_518590 [Fennellomyces sp. T-0311]|nr:hypothetical protein BJV82DRAFT_518590 [Fennellomyces sp. T-0311]
MSSFSWVADKSSAELTSLLKNAYSTLREKDRDLALAAEIGKSLLENNMCLKSRYEDLLEQVNQCNQSLPSPSIDDGWDSANGSQDDDDEQDAMRLISNQNAREALIEALERKNAEMQNMLDNALNESAATGQANEKQIKKLHYEIELLRSNLDCAAQKIQELEDARNARQERARQSPGNYDDPSPLCNIDEDQLFAEELAEKMAQMRTENDQLVYAKQAIEQKLETALVDLNNLRDQFHQFQFTQQGYDNLQEAYQRQFKHIEELNTSLEEHRTILSRLRDRGIGWSPKPSPSPSEYGGVVTSPQSLLGELENAWFRNLQQKQDSCSSAASSDSNDSCLSSLTKLRDDVASLTEQNLASFYRAPAEYALESLVTTGFKENSIIQEAARYIKGSVKSGGSNIDLFSPTGSIYAAHDLYPRISSELLLTSFDCRYSRRASDYYSETDLFADMPSGLVGRTCWILRCLFRALLQWCRFSFILMAAILINLWQGPDAIMEK